jgi:hypothetical protein
VGLKKDKASISGVAAKAAVALCKARAEALSMTPSKFLGLLVEWWVKNGAPPLNKPDAVTMQGLEQLIADAQASYEPGAKPPPAPTLAEMPRRERHSFPPAVADAAARTATKRKPRPARRPGK